MLVSWQRRANGRSVLLGDSTTNRKGRSKMEAKAKYRGLRWCTGSNGEIVAEQEPTAVDAIDYANDKLQDSAEFSLCKQDRRVSNCNEVKRLIETVGPEKSKRVSVVSHDEPVAINAILNLLQDDPHQWSTRPCPTCKKITKLVGRYFGCDLHKDKKHS